ncbi:hypothetical protein Lfu02_41060 [Longispora fulva]|uniref:Lipoprotein n=1 Tax=Longispora fulva TaxID=619741 RepID=A0A8J7KJ57_9ACTN|nr:hypothetical protein [Longispora fulva]MBG6136564.1 hypothetical protein [Longispora fulva]GIG59734.1 hypothetical protein Lfu02_41060 [Longispora fulva]
MTTRMRIATLVVVATLPLTLLGCAATGATTASPAAGGDRAFCEKWTDGKGGIKQYTGTDVGADKATLEADLRTMAEHAPAGVKGDIQVLVDANIAVLDGQPGAMEKLLGPEVSTAGQRVRSWINAHCPH